MLAQMEKDFTDHGYFFFFLTKKRYSTKNSCILEKLYV